MTVGHFSAGSARAWVSRAARVLAVAGTVALAGCTVAQVNTHGYVPDDELVEAIRPGFHDRDAVQRLLGSPSSIGTFESQYWYYVSRTVENFAFFPPETLDQQVLVVEYDALDTVAELYRFDIEDGQVIDPVTRTTPTRGRKLSIIQQLLGNIGRFNPQ